MDHELFVSQVKLLVADVADVDLALALGVGMEGEVLSHGLHGGAGHLPAHLTRQGALHLLLLDQSPHHGLILRFH